MIRKVLALAFLLAFPLTAAAQPAVTIQRTTLMSAYDLDGEAADDDQVVTAAGGVIVDNGTSVGGVNYTITAQPDSCRLLDMTIADTDMTAGTITVTGLGCLGEAKVCVHSTWTAGDDDGVKTLVCTDGGGAYFASVTSVTTGTMTGESDETFKLGYTSNSAVGWPMYGTRYTGPNGEYGINPFGMVDIPKRVTTSGSSSTTLTGVTAAEDAFELVSVGDILVLPIGGTPYERRVTAKASNDSVTLNAAINIPAAGYTYRWKKLWFSTNPAHGMYIPVHGFSTMLLDWSVDANANTGGIVLSLQCANGSPDWPTATWVTMCPTAGVDCLGITNSVASAATKTWAETVNLTALPFTHCKVGWKFGTGDDGDAAAEDVNAVVTLLK